MARKKINAENIIKLTGATTVLSMATGASGSFILAGMYPDYEISTIGCMILAWIIPHSWILIAAVDSLREELGFRSPVKIAGNWAGKTLGRKIPITSGDKKTDIFMSNLALPEGVTGTLPEEIVELKALSIWYNDNSYTVTIPEIEEFLYVAWRRQTQSKNGLSRHYWTKIRRPIISTLRYNLIINILIKVSGLIIDRSEARSGRLAIDPQNALKTIQNTF